MSVISIYKFLSNNLGKNNGWFTFNEIRKGTGLSVCSARKGINRLMEREDIYRKDSRYEEMGFFIDIEDGSYIFYKAKRI